jgi:NAD(P)-dependent dehydrogenase (short-subunit alcohol dehydrogenase family)
MKEFGIRVTNVEPGGIETEFAKRSLATAKSELAAYRDTAAHVPRLVFAAEQDLPGDAHLAAKAIIAIVEADDSPVHLLLGEDAVHYAEQQRTAFSVDMDKWMPLSMSIKKARGASDD